MFLLLFESAQNYLRHCDFCAFFLAENAFRCYTFCSMDTISRSRTMFENQFVNTLKTEQQNVFLDVLLHRSFSSSPTLHV